MGESKRASLRYKFGGADVNQTPDDGNYQYAGTQIYLNGFRTSIQERDYVVVWQSCAACIEILESVLSKSVAASLL